MYHPLLGSHLDFPEYGLMAVSYRLIHKFEVATKNKEKYVFFKPRKI